VSELEKMFAEKFPDLMPQPPQEPAPAAPVASEPEPKPVAVAPEKKGFFSRAADIVTLKDLRESDSEEKEREEREERERQAMRLRPRYYGAQRRR